MREIKFRAWDKSDKKMCLWIEEKDDDEWKIILSHNDGGSYYELPDVFKREHLEVMQFTGLKDKNGKEIYEGDVLRVESHGGVEIVEVKYEERYAGFNFFQGDEVCPLTDYTDMMGFDLNANIIGNIYENPKLMEAKV